MKYNIYIYIHVPTSSILCRLMLLINYKYVVFQFVFCSCGNNAGCTDVCEPMGIPGTLKTKNVQVTYTYSVNFQVISRSMIC